VTPKISNRTLFILLCLLLPFSRLKSEEIMNVMYLNNTNDGINSIGYKALDFALKKSGVKYKINIYPIQANNKRIQHLLKDSIIDVSDFGTSIEYEEQYNPIYFPIDMGLNGWRTFIIRKDNQYLFPKGMSRSDLIKRSLGQVHGWSDIETYKNNNVQVMTGPRVSSLFKMTKYNRFNYFPLGVNEIIKMYRKNSKVNSILTIEKNILLIYPFARYFFVQKHRPKLYKAIQKGLSIGFNDGSYKKMFLRYKHHQEIARSLNLGSRTIIHMKNKFLSKRSRNLNPKYFLELNDFK